MAALIFAVCVLFLIGLGAEAKGTVPNPVPESGCEFGMSQNGTSQVCLNLKCPDLPPRTCKDVKATESRPVVRLSDGNEVMCDTQTDGGGWIVFHRRVSADVDFYCDWIDYKYGFGNIAGGNFWWGNEKIHRLTVQGRYQLRVDFTFNDTRYFAVYSSFRILGEAEKYQLQVEGYSGTTGDSLSVHNGMAFSTKDMDNDVYDTSCSTQFHGAWWYQRCHQSNLNGLWGSKNYADGLSWFTTTGHYDTATSTEMKIKPID